jgi:hypothetical protein
MFRPTSHQLLPELAGDLQILGWVSGCSNGWATGSRRVRNNAIKSVVKDFIWQLFNYL